MAPPSVASAPSVAPAAPPLALSSLDTSLDDELSLLRRAYHRSNLPADTTQFCADHFNRRLESQRKALVDQLKQHQEPPPRPPHSSSRAAAASAVRPPLLSTPTFTDPSPSPFDERPPPLSPTIPTFSLTPSDCETVQPQDEMATTQQAEFSFGSSGFVPGESLPPIAGSSPLPQNYNFNRRTSVSAESIAPGSEDDSNWVPPVFPKTQEQQQRLHKAISPNFLFAHIDPEQTAQVLGALKEYPVPAKSIRVISQGDVGDYFYVVEHGTFDIYVSDEKAPDFPGRKVATISDGGSFGELALMYSTPRAATVISTGPSTLWQLDRVTFRRIIMDSAFQRRRMYESFLAEVPLLKGLTDYERCKIADALNAQRFNAGDVIIREADAGENFYLLESGEAEAHKHGETGPVATYQRGDYFGELALLDNKPRAASIVASSESKVAILNREGFQRLLGPQVQELLRKNDPRKRASLQAS